MRLPHLLVLAALTATPALAASPVGVISRLHMPMLHFPIAVLVVAVVLELVLRKRGDTHRPAVAALLALGALAAFVATASGIALEQVENEHSDLVEWHERLGILTTILATLSAIAYRRPDGALRKLSLPLMIASALAVAVAGHLGGRLVHGADYYTEVFAEAGTTPKEPAPTSTTTTTTAAPPKGDDHDDDGGDARVRNAEGAIPEKPEFAAHIKPLFEKNCFKCHGPDKRKGGLRLDEKRFAMKGGESGAAIVAGDPAKSLVYSMAALPADDEDVMPTKGNLLALSELETLKRWIEHGAVWPDDAPTP